MNANPPFETRELTDAAIETLRQGEAFLAEISEENYTRKVPAVFNASVGGHYRHCLDHFRNLLAAAGSGELNYDHRERGTMVETNRFAALNATRELRQGYQSLHPGCLTRPLFVTCKTNDAASNSQASGSTVGREIMYCVAHAVHHYALIGVMGAIVGFALPPNFGIAPSTLKHQRESVPAA